MHPAASLVRRSVHAGVSVLALVLGLPCVAVAQVEQTFFAKQYDHAVAGPNRAADTIAVPDNFTGPFTLRIQNGTDLNSSHGARGAGAAVSVALDLGGGIQASNKRGVHKQVGNVGGLDAGRHDVAPHAGGNILRIGSDALSH